jgi:hypothetical protein
VGRKPDGCCRRTHQHDGHNKGVFAPESITKKRIERGEFNFADEFPDYRFRTALPTANYVEAPIKPETCNQVADKFIAYCELRVWKDDMALSTLEDYKEVLDRVVRPEIGSELFTGVIYSRLAAIVAANTKDVKKKTYNNVVSVV